MVGAVPGSTPARTRVSRRKGTWVVAVELRTRDRSEDPGQAAGVVLVVEGTREVLKHVEVPEPAGAACIKRAAVLHKKPQVPVHLAVRGVGFMG